MRRPLLTAALVSFAAVAVPAQEMESGKGDVPADGADGAEVADVKDIEIRPVWKPGLVVKFERVRETRETNRQGVTKGHTITTPVTMRVRTATGEQFEVDWSYGTSVVATVGGARNPFLDAASNLLEGATAKLVIDDLADPKTVANGAALLAHAQQGIEELEVKFAATGWVRNAVNQLRSQVQRESQLTGKILAEARLIFMCSGGDYPPGKPLAYQQEIPQPFGNQFGRAKVTTAISFTLAAPAPNAPEFIVKFAHQIDADAARAPLYAAYRQFAERRGLRMPNSDAELGEIEFRDDAVFVLDAKTGLPRRVTHVRRIKIAKTSRSESNRLRLLSVTR